MSQCPMQSSVDRHFDATITPDEERRMREHLSACKSCHAYYGRHLVLASLDPTSHSAEVRIAKGLGLGRSRLRALIPFGAIGTLAAAAAVLMFARPSGFSARGSVNSTQGSHVTVYDVRPGARPTLAGGVIGRHDELAFAYENTDAKRRLMIFGLDEHGDVYWFYPAWTRASENPEAVPIALDASRHELPEAVSQAFDGKHLDVHALFMNEPVAVRQVEAMVAKRGPGSSPVVLPGAVDSVVSFDIAP